MPIQPIDYSIDVQSPIEATVQGLQLGKGIADLRAQQEAAELKRQQAQILRADLNALVSNPNATAADYGQMITKHPQLSEQLKRGWDVLDEGVKQSRLSQGSQVYAALQSNRPDIAIAKLKEQAEANRNSGDEQQAKALEDAARLVELNPDSAKTTVGLMLASTIGPEKFAETFGKLGAEQITMELHTGELKKQLLDQGKTEAETNKAIVAAKKMEAEIAKTNAEAGKIAQESALKKAELENVRVGDIDLSKNAEKLINESVSAAANLRSLSNQYEKLADSFDADISSGVPGRVSESVKKLYGSENRITRLRQEYKRLRNSQVLDNLPPGVASDKDIEIAMGAFPEDTANPVEIASFLRGVSKLQTYDAKLNDIKAEWVNDNGSLGRARREIIVGGTTYPRGANLSDVIAEQLMLVSPIEDIGQEQPKTPQDVRAKADAIIGAK